MMTTKYSVTVYWNPLNDVFVAEMPELNGCVAHGETQDEALKEINILASTWLETAREQGWRIPEPRGKLRYL